MDRFDAMQAFARVVETGSFTRAAETLQINKTTVTQLVQQLEARLRVKLLNRTTRRVNVTADGAVYYERVTRLLVDMAEAEASLSISATAPAGKLRVDVPSPLGRILLVPALAGFYERYPGIQIEMGVSDRPVDLIDENVDCVLRAGQITDPSLVARHVGDLRYGVFAAPNYLQRAGVPVHPRQIAEANHHVVGFVSARSGKALPFVLRRGAQSINVQGRQVLAVNEGGAYVAAAVAGLGISLVPMYMAEPHVARGELVALFEGWHSDPQPLYVAYPPNRHVSARLRVFINWLAERMAVHAPLVGRQER
jgi:DNA-binding transcriptional LysR family regulator